MPTHCPSLLTRAWAALRAAHAGLPALTLLTLLLAGLPARAANYTFPGALPAGCVDSGSGNYSCGTLTLIDSDTVTIAAPKPATITFSGAFTTGSNTTINAAGANTDLTINSAGAVAIGLNVNFNGSIISSAAVSIGNNSTVNGYILTTLSTGVVTIGDNNVIGGYINTEGGAVTVGGATTVKGSIKTVDGVVTIGPGTAIQGSVSTDAGAITASTNVMIDGSVQTQAGVVAIGAGSTIKGSVSTDAGAITTSANVTIKGSIGTQIGATRAGTNTKAGVITIGDANNINGTLSTDAGAITVGAGSIVGGAATPTGVITFGAGVTSGDVISGAGAINIGANDLLCGKVLAYGAGVVTLTTGVKVDGSISTTAGAITVGVGSTVAGDITVTGAGVVTLTGVLVAGNVSTTAGAITLTSSKVRGSVAASGAGVVTLTPPSMQNDNSFTLTAACAAAPPPVVTTPTTTAASFDVLEHGVLWNPIPSAHNPIYTKLAGNAFSLDIAALKTDRTLESAYVDIGAITRHVTLELFDDTGAECGDYITPVATQTASFRPALLSIVPGRALSGAFIVDKVHSSLLVRIKECTDAACTSLTSTPAACSTDRFSVRPSALTLSTATAMPSSKEPAATASQTIRAGTDFTLRAHTNQSDGYDGVLALDASKLTAQSPSQDESAQNGGAVGVLTPSTLTANATATMATYSEAGYLYISPGAYRDDNFTAVDSAVDDCITSAVNNNYLADTLIDGKYGCSIGNKLTVRMGRFIPHHFSTEIVADTEILKNTVMPCPAGLICPPGQSASPRGFIIYARQPFAITVTARSLSGTPTLNYRDKLARDVTLTAWSTEGGAAAAGPTGSVLGYSPGPVAATTFAFGVAGARPSYAFATSYPATPLTAPTNIYLRAAEIGPNSDGVTSLRTAASSSVEAGIKVVSGRLHLANNYGSELLAVPIVIHAQYWDGTRFVNSATDQKTRLDSAKLARSNCKKNLNVNGNCMTLSITPAAPIMVNGAIKLLLGAPGAKNTGSIDLRTDMFDWLPSTIARIGVGIYKAGPVIYMREMY